MKKASLLKLLVVAALPLACGSVFAASVSAPLAVSASIFQSCSITTTPVAFGAYDPVVTNAVNPLNASGSVTVTCSKGSSGLTVGMDNGLHYTTSRQMMGTTSLEFLQYGLFQPPSNTPGAACTFPGGAAWTTAATLALVTAPSKAARTYNVCGSIPGGQDIAVDPVYGDTVSATINF